MEHPIEQELELQKLFPDPRNIKREVDDYLNKRPHTNLKELYWKFSKDSKNTIRKYFNDWRREREKFPLLKDLKIFYEAVRFKANFTKTLSKEEVLAMENIADYIKKVVK